MKILWLTWKDQFHPEAGGAEVICRELTKRLASDGHEVTLLTCGYEGALPIDTSNGIQTIRVGNNRYAHTFQALGYYMRHLRGKFDVVIEEVNAAPYFSVFFGRRSRRFLLFHQLERKVWFYETKFPLSTLGHYLLEPIAARLLSLSKTPVITVSDSTRQDLARHGFAPSRTSIISEGVEIEPLLDLNGQEKYRRPTVLSLGAMRAMKRTLHQVKAFERAKKAIPDLQMKIAGQATSDYAKEVLKYIEDSPYSDDIQYLGKVSREEKRLLMQRSHLITVTSVKEGWGLIVTEAASQGTPAVVYNIDGLRDSVRHDETGVVTPERPEALADGIINLLDNPKRYRRLRQAAWEWSKSITFDQSYKDFTQIIGIK